MSNAMQLPDDQVRAEADRRARARQLGLPLSTPLAEIELHERAKTWPFTGEERPGPRRSNPDIRPPAPRSGADLPDPRFARESVKAPKTIGPEIALQPDCVCQHAAALHDFEKRCTACRCRRYRSREAQHEQSGIRFMKGLGFKHINYASRSRSKIHPGHPDHLFLHPTRRLRVFWEAKGDDGVASEEQLAFQVLAEASGIPCVIGRLSELRSWVTRTLSA